MKRFICYYRTLKEWKLFLYTLFNFGAIYIAHDYEEVFNGYVFTVEIGNCEGMAKKIIDIQDKFRQGKI